MSHRVTKRTVATIVLACGTIAAGLATALAQGPWNKPIPTDNFCIVCHSDVQVDLSASVHSREGIKCADCHGGDPRAQTVAGAHAGNFHRSFDRKQLVALCSSCHSDPAKMKPYGIPTDQLALYQTSVHGQKWAQGDTRVAVCSDCHGTHKILAASDPKSPVFRENIPDTCGRCHQNSEMMKGYNLPDNIVSDYKEGIHGKALLERHNRQSPDCTRCHGTHGAAPPGIGDVAKVCGQCHTKTLEAFRQSPHKTVLTVGNQSDCASCHSNHRVEHATHSLWTTSCTECHQPGSSQAERAKKIQALFVQAEEEIEKAKSAIEDARRIPLAVADYEARLADAGTYMVEARPLSHDLSVDNSEELTRRARSIALEIQSEVHQKMGVFKGRTIVLILVLFYVLISIGLARKFRNILNERRARRSAETPAE
jgi:predicted CXXCH cytochrome family protein